METSSGKMLQEGEAPTIEPETTEVCFPGSGEKTKAVVQIKVNFTFYLEMTEAE